MKFSLRPFQQTGVKFLLDNKRALLADDMGGGKTYQTLEAIKQIDKDVVTVLVVCPAALTLMWDHAISYWFDESFQVVHLRKEKKPVQLNGKYRFCIVSYNYLRENYERLEKVKWHCIVADEAHSCKNWRSKTCKAFLQIVKKCSGYIWMLTGTPATRNGQDYYTYLEVMQPGKWGTFWQFSEMFCNKNYFNGYEGLKESKRPLLNAAFKKVMLRRLRTQFEGELPDKVLNYLPVEIDPVIISQVSDISKEEVLLKLQRGEKLDEHIMRAVRLIGLGKVPAAMEWLHGINEPVVVFCKHVDVAVQLEAQLQAQNKRVGLITGGQSREEKDKAVSDFQNGELDVIVCNIAAGGVGITLHRASYMLFVESDWSPALMDQAMSRIIRIGAKSKKAFITVLMAHGTVDEVIQDILNYKEKFMKEVMGDGHR